MNLALDSNPSSIPARPLASRFRAISLAALLAVIIVLGFFIWEGRTGLSLADEGYLWYGAERTMLGDVPIRDFMAYDPGRYYWCAALMQAFGNNGIMSLRVAVAIFEALGLVCALLVIRSEAKPTGVLQVTAAAFVLVLWMFPRHKLFDVTVCLMLVAALGFLLSRPTRLRYLMLGAAVGLAATIGRNHGVYGVGGSALGMAYLMIGSDGRRSVLSGAPVWALGVVIGYLPVLSMLVVVPGFARAFLQDVLFLLSIKTTNLPLPVPWPWAAVMDGHSGVWRLRDVLIGCTFLSLLAVGTGAIIFVVAGRLRRREYSAGLVASACFILPYAHYAFSRADIGHLALGIFPLLLTLLILAGNLRPTLKWISLAGLLGASALIMLPAHPGWQCGSNACADVQVGGDKLLLDRGTASDVTLLQRLAHDFAPQGGSFVATPFWPGAYAVLGCRSPVWEIYALSPYRTPEFEHTEIERIRAASAGFVIVLDIPLDGRDELRFRNTHPLMTRYFSEQFVRVSGYSDNPDYWIYKKKAVGN